MPEFTHWEVCVFEILHEVSREYVTTSRFINHGQSLFVAQFRHTAIELVGKQIAYYRTPVMQETGSGFRIVDDIAENARQPCT